MFKGITIDVWIIMLIAVVFVPVVGIFFSEGSILYNVFMIIVLTVVAAIAIVLAENRFDSRPFLGLPLWFRLSPPKK